MEESRMRKEEIAEDYCFVCKDGGTLIICDYGDCLKVYHPNCVEKDPSFLETGAEWFCGLHSCCFCHKSPNFQCLACPTSICQLCIRDAEFVRVKGKSQGFCWSCLKLITSIEENADYDSDWGKLDFEDRASYAFLFKDYWEIIKKRELLSSEDVISAFSSLKNSRHDKEESNFNKCSKEKQELTSDKEYLDLSYSKFCGYRSRPRAYAKRTRQKFFLGWGSEELINFLISIDKDVTMPMTQFDVADIITAYAQENKLIHPDKKRKKVMCDEKLFSLFKKKAVKTVKIHKLLESHFSANEDLEDALCIDFDDVENFKVQKKHRTESSPKTYNLQTSDGKEPAKSCFASLIGKNIKLIYLKRSLLQELLKITEEFEDKVMGCFVRVKNDPKDFFYSPEKLYQLAKVTGTRKSQEAYSIGEQTTNIVLRVSNISKDICISMLSDDDFEEEECEDLRQLVKKGLLTRPTIAELEQKIAVIHMDITNHWIKKENVTLQKQIDRANEKGWRRELFELIEKRELLRTPAEQERLIKEIPKVIPEPVEDKLSSLMQACERHGGNEAAKSKINEEKLVRNEVDFDGNSSEKEPKGKQMSLCTPGGESLIWKEFSRVISDTTLVVQDDLRTQFLSNEKHQVDASTAEEPDKGASVFKNTHLEQELGEEAYQIAIPQIITVEKHDNSSEIKENSGACHVVEIDDNDHADVSQQKQPLETQIIILDDDDDDDDDGGGGGGNVSGGHNGNTNSSTRSPSRGKVANICQWNYLDPLGNVQGPFQLYDMEWWRKQGYFDEDFKVWRVDQSREDAILLTDALRLI